MWDYIVYTLAFIGAWTVVCGIVLTWMLTTDKGVEVSVDNNEYYKKRKRATYLRRIK